MEVSLHQKHFVQMDCDYLFSLVCALFDPVSSTCILCTTRLKPRQVPRYRQACRIPPLMITNIRPDLIGLLQLYCVYPLQRDNRALAFEPLHSFGVIHHIFRSAFFENGGYLLLALLAQGTIGVYLLLY